MVSNWNQRTSGTNQTVTALSYGHLTISNSGINTLAGTITPSGDLTVSGGTFDLGTYTANRASAGGTVTVSGGATLKIGGTGGFPSNYTTNTLVSTSTVEYNGTGAQTVGAQNYGYLIVSGARTTNNVTLASSGTIGIASTFTNTATFTTGAYVITGSTTISTVLRRTSGYSPTTILRSAAAGPRQRRVFSPSTARSPSAME